MRAAWLVGATLAVAPPLAHAGATAAPDPYDDIREDATIDAHGLVDLSYAGNRDHP
jgi:hypothetical protein